MHDRARRNAFTFQYLEEVIKSVTRVDHERQIELVGETDLGGERLTLRHARRVFVEVVEPALADSHESWVASSGQLHYGRDVVEGVVGVKADRGVDVDVTGHFAQCQGLARGLRVGTDDHESVHVGFERAGQGGVHVSDHLIIL